MAAEYLKKVFNAHALKRIATEVWEVVKDTQAEIIVARGISGIAVAVAVNVLFDVPYAIVRKPGESSHSGKTIEFVEEPDESCITKPWHRWLIVDDFIFTGHTMSEIDKAIKEMYWIFKGQCVGIVLYNDRNDREEWTISDKDVQIYRVGDMD